MFLRCCAEEAHEHRHLCMSYGHVRNPRQLIPGQDRTTTRTGESGVLYATLRRYATQVWPQQRSHRIQHYDAEWTCMRFRSAAGAAFGVEGFDGARGCCGVECRRNVQSHEGFLVHCLCNNLRVSAEDEDEGGEDVRGDVERTGSSRERDASVARRAGARLPVVSSQSAASVGYNLR